MSFHARLAAGSTTTYPAALCLTFTATDGTGATVTSGEYQVNGGSWLSATATSPVGQASVNFSNTPFQVTALPEDRNYTICVRATDSQVRGHRE